jgi:hypothetical protein
LKNDVNVASKRSKQKKLGSKISFFPDILKVNDEYSRIRIQDPNPDPDPNLNPDPLVRGMDLRIRIHPKMSWIRNTGPKYEINQTLFICCSDTRLLLPLVERDTKISFLIFIFFP